MSFIYTNKDIPYQFQDEIRETEIKTGLTRQAGIRRGQRFLKGPIPLPDIAAAARLPGKSLALFLAVRHQADLTGQPVVTVPTRLLAEFGISRSTKARCLKSLEDAGLIEVERSKGRAARIQLRKTKGETNVVNH